MHLYYPDLGRFSCGLGFRLYPYCFWETRDNNCLGVQKGKKIVGRSRRSWKSNEETILIEQLKELVANRNWKTDNDFRPGYLLEEMLALGETGCGFNTATKILDCSDTAWAKVMKKDSSVSRMQYKPWPYYADWLEVFGCDRVVGAPPTDVVHVAAKIEAEDSQPQVGVAEPSASNVAEDEFEMEADNHEPNVDTSKVRATSQSSSKKRTHSQSFGKKEMISALGEIFKAYDDQIGDIVKSITYEAKPAPTPTCKNVFNMLESITELSLDECLDAAELLSKNPQRLEMFIWFHEAARTHYVRHLLAGDFNHKGVT
ncbi:hypothetical protein ACS0TY_025614 [Phlomoides rotata]